MVDEINVSLEIVENKNLATEQKIIINKARKKNFGKHNVKEFFKDYEPGTKWFFVKNGKQVVALGGIRPINVEHLGKYYKIGGICSIISLKKKKGYGRILMSFMVDYSIRTGKTILGFTGQTKFFRKADLGTEKDFIKRFVWIKPDGEKSYDNKGDGIYYEGKDKFISRVLKTKSPVSIFVEFW